MLNGMSSGEGAMKVILITNKLEYFCNNEFLATYSFRLYDVQCTKLIRTVIKVIESVLNVARERGAKCPRTHFLAGSVLADGCWKNLW